MSVTIIDVPTETPTTMTDDRGFGALETEKGVLPLKAMDVRTQITGLSYTTTLTQTFVNALDEAMEATYIFPLPSRAAVSRFRFKINDRVIEGVLKERSQARREYNEAIQAGHRAALAEEDRPSVFTMKVGNIMPGETAQVELDLNGQVTFCDGEAEFRFPLVVAPRYVPGIPLDGPSVGDGVAVDTDQVPDASRISPPVLLPGFPNPLALGLEVTVDGAGLPVRDLGCSLQVVEQDTDDQEIHTVKLYPGERLNRDFILRFKVAAEAVSTSLTVVPAEDKSGGTFMLTLVPPDMPEQPLKPRDVVFVLDRSGSMGGWKMVCARRSIGRMVDTLNTNDRFQVMAFDNRIEFPAGHREGSWITGTDANRFRTMEWLGSVGAEGGTEMAEPMYKAVKLLKSSEGRERMIVLVTDGQVGNESGILKKIGKDLENIKVFTLGIDRSVNEGFLQRLASLGGGHCELIESEDRLDEVMHRTHRRIGTPILTDLHVKMVGAELQSDTLSPSRLPDLFAGAPAFICGRYTGEKPTAIEVVAKAGPEAWSSTVDGHVSDDKAVSKLWARWRIRDLEDQVDASWGESGLEKTITDLSLQEEVLCRYTAFVAIDRSETVNEGGKLQQITQPVESPEGWDMMAGGAVDNLCCMDEGLTATLSRSAASPITHYARPGSPTFAAKRMKCRAPAPKGSGSSFLGGMARGISNIFGGSKEESVESEMLADFADEGEEYDSLSGVVQALKDLFDELKEALTKGTDHLAATLWAKRDDLMAMVEAYATLGGDGDLARRLGDVSDALQETTKQPDSAKTVELWRALEGIANEL